jgi:phosphoribosyl-ATP pyrophosphohydrolase
MSTPKQEQKTIETPFGTATVNDWRGSSNGKDTRASITFDHFTVNRKEYGSITLYLEKWHGIRNFTITTMNYRDLTDAARRAVVTYFTPVDNIHADLAPYAEDLDPEDVRADLKSRVAHKVLRELHDTVTGFVNVEDRDLINELVDEVLVETMLKRQHGLSFTKIYLSL